MRCKDQLHRTLYFPSTPQRIVSLVPSQTELLVDLGLEENLVGITKFCVHPPGLKKKLTVIGGTKNVKFEKIATLQPDIIIANKEENTKEIVALCEKIAPVWVSDIYNIADTFDMVLKLGSIFNVLPKAKSIVQEINVQWEDFKKFKANKPSKKVYYLIWKNPYMAAGAPTFIDYLLSLNNFKNLANQLQGRYPEVTTNLLQEAEIILLSSEPYPFKEQDVVELKKALDKDVLLVDGEFFSWYGSRLIKAFQYFKKLH